MRVHTHSVAGLQCLQTLPETFAVAQDFQFNDEDPMSKCLHYLVFALFSEKEHDIFYLFFDIAGLQMKSCVDCALLRMFAKRKLHKFLKKNFLSRAGYVDASQ